MKKDKKMMPWKRGSKCLMTAVAFSLSLLPAQGEAVHFTILPTSPEQHIQHFGASDAWSMQFLGLWPEKQQEQIADWLFSVENDEMGNRRELVCRSGDSIWAQEARNRERLRRFSEEPEPNAF